jgi:hypothetical protein
MARITTQWLRGSDLETVLARDLSLVARWLGSISAHENRIKKVYPIFFFLLVNANFLFFFFFFFSFFFFFFFFFFEFSNLEIRNLIFFFFFLNMANEIKGIQRKIKGFFFSSSSLCQFSTFFFFFFFRILKFNFLFLFIFFNSKDPDRVGPGKWSKPGSESRVRYYGTG